MGFSDRVLGVNPNFVRQLCFLAGRILSWLGSDQDIEELLHTAAQLDKQDKCTNYGHRIKFAPSNGHALNGPNECVLGGAVAIVADSRPL